MCCVALCCVGLCCVAPCRVVMCCVMVRCVALCSVALCCVVCAGAVPCVWVSCVWVFCVAVCGGVRWRRRWRQRQQQLHQQQREASHVPDDETTEHAGANSAFQPVLRPTPAGPPAPHQRESQWPPRERPLRCVRGCAWMRQFAFSPALRWARRAALEPKKGLFFETRQAGSKTGPGHGDTTVCHRGRVRILNPPGGHQNGSGNWFQPPRKAVHCVCAALDCLAAAGPHR